MGNLIDIQPPFILSDKPDIPHFVSSSFSFHMLLIINAKKHMHLEASKLGYKETIYCSLNFIIFGIISILGTVTLELCTTFKYIILV